MFGAVEAWFYQTLGGIRLDLSLPEPDSLAIAPYFDSPLKHWRAIRAIPAGRVVSAGRKKDNSIEWEVEIPANSLARLSLSVTGKPPAGVRENGRELREGAIPGIHGIEAHDDRLDLVVGSGRYEFVLDLPENRG
jgi:alpha-L-rhamnosidase